MRSCFAWWKTLWVMLPTACDSQLCFLWLLKHCWACAVELVNNATEVEQVYGFFPTQKLVLHAEPYFWVFLKFGCMHPLKSRNTDFSMISIPFYGKGIFWFCAIGLFLCHKECNSVRNAGCRNTEGHDDNIEEKLEQVKAVWVETWTWVNNVLLAQQIC